MLDAQRRATEREKILKIKKEEEERKVFFIEKLLKIIPD
jgi:hypothetical protein